jgi:hypothetical protein
MDNRPHSRYASRVIRRAPHTVQPVPPSARVLLVYRSFNKVSHVGLGISSLNTSRVLRASGTWADAWAAGTVDDINAKLEALHSTAHTENLHPVSHVVIQAPWVQTKDMQAMLMRWPDVHFCVLCHSNIGFLQVDPNAIRLMREQSELTLSHHNFSVGGNCQRFTDAWVNMYGVPMAWLPNLYDVSTIKPVGQRVPWVPGSTLRIGVFGALRPLKNMVSSVAAAMDLAHQSRADVEIWMSDGRNEGGGTTLPAAIDQLTSGVANVKLMKAGWQTWPAFRQTVGKMNLLLNASYTESFQIVCADGIAEGVASVTSDAVDWAPSDWCANADDVTDIASTARRLLSDPHAVDAGQRALKVYTAQGLLAWQAYLRSS